MNLLPSAMWQGTLVYIHFTLLAYAPKQICLPHCTYMFHWTATVVYIDYRVVHKKCNFYLPCYCHICASNKHAPQMPYICHMCKLVYVWVWDKYINIYTSYDPTATMWPGTLVYIHFILLTYVPEQICLPHTICKSHCTTTVVYIQTPPQFTTMWKTLSDCISCISPIGLNQSKCN